MGGGKLQLWVGVQKNISLKWAQRSIELTNLLATRQKSGV